MLPAIRKADDVPADPWGGQTLEWATTSPPPLGNFDELPVVTSAEPLLDHGRRAPDGRDRGFPRTPLAAAARAGPPPGPALGTAFAAAARSWSSPG